jgi:hypothetical protein
MRDVGVLSRVVVPDEQLREVVSAFAVSKGQPVSHSVTESVIAEERESVYVMNLEPENSAYYSDEERLELELKLGGPVNGCVSIHFASSDIAMQLALALAQEVARRWSGVLDYGGMGGDVGVPPPTLK